MSDNLIDENIYALRPVFIFRLSSIGDVVIAARTVQYFVKNNYEPCFVSSIKLKDILLKIKDLKHFICFDNNYKPIYFLNQQEVDMSEFRNYFCKKIKYIKKGNEFDANEGCSHPVFCDLQNTFRSKRAIRIIGEKIFEKEKIIVNKVKKNFLFRFFILLESYLKTNQIQRHIPMRNIKRIHELQLDTVNRIFEKDKKPKQTITQNVYLFKDPNISKKKYICVFPGASGNLKIWPKKHFKTLIDLILERTLYDVYICDYEESFRSLTEDTIHASRLHNVTGRHSLAQSLNLIANSTYVFCNDSFAAHVADAYQVPATVIFGATTPRFGFVPVYSRIRIKYLNLNCSPCSRHGKGTCRFRNLRCLTGLDPNEIFNDFLSNQLEGPQNV